MVSITVFSRADRIKIYDEKTYQDVELNFECSEEKENFLIKITKEILKGE